MERTVIEREATVWMANDIPTRMFYAGRSWRVTDTPTRISDPVWAMPLHGERHMFGWRFQGTDDSGESFVFDVYRAEDGCHVHHTYD